MAKVSVYNQTGKATSSMEVSEAVFGVKAKSSVVHQVYTALRANLRSPWADTKDRGEVRGGGKKPWKQKGTGRARHGSTRSPIWRGGGITFGPLSIRNYKQKVNKKMNRLAVRMCLSDKLREERLLVVDEFPADGKTKSVAALRMALPGNGKSTLFVLDEQSQPIVSAAKNLSAVDTGRALDINVVDLLHHQYIVVSQKAVAMLEKRLAPQEKSE